jgi:large subunit ribosomal protein L25
MAKKHLSLSSQSRSELGKITEDLRQQGRIPAVVYGAGKENQHISLAYNECEKVYREAGESSLVDLSIDDGGPVATLIHDIQFSPATNRISHIDFFRVTMTEKLHASVELVFIGESKAVKEHGAILVKNISELEVRCFPKDLVSEIEVDLSVLNNIEDSVAIHDIVIPPGIEVLHHEPEDIVVIATPPITDEELAKMETTGAQAPAEVPPAEEKEKKEEGE